MSDNVAITAGSGTTIATDDVGGVQYQRVKPAFGADGSATDVSPLWPLPVAVAMADSFGRLPVALQSNDIEVNWARDATVTSQAAITTTGTGAASQVTGSLNLSTGASTAGTAKAVSTEYLRYRVGGEVYVLFTAAWSAVGAASSYQRVGLYDANEGFWIGYSDATWGVAVRTGGSDTQTAKASFNGDLLTGAAGSRFTRGGAAEAIDLTKINVFRIRFGWLGSAPVRFEVLSPDGDWVLMHVIRQPNNATTPHIRSTILPMTAEVGNTATTSTSKTLVMSGWAAGDAYAGDAAHTASDTLATAANSVVNYSVNGVGQIRVRVGTSTTGTIVFEGTVDGQNWFTHPAVTLLGAAGAPSTPVNAAVTPASGSVYTMRVDGYRVVRVRTATLLGATVVLHSVFTRDPSTVDVASLPPAPGTVLAAQVTVSSSTTQIAAARTVRSRVVTIVNRQTVAVYVGATAATTSMLRLDPGDSIELATTSRVDGITAAAYTATGDAKVHVIEAYD